MTLEGEAEAVYELLRGEGFVKESIDLDPDAVLDYLLPIIEPAQAEEFTFSRGWMRGQAARIADPRSPAHQLGKQLNLPPSYLLIHRVTLSTIGVLCQLDATVRMRDELEEWLPGFLADAPRRVGAGGCRGGVRTGPGRPGGGARALPPGGVEPAFDGPDVGAGAVVAVVAAGAVLDRVGPGRRWALGRGRGPAGEHTMVSATGRFWSSTLRRYRRARRFGATTHRGGRSVRTGPRVDGLLPVVRPASTVSA